MGHSKQNKNANKKDGKHRVETREERKQRLKEQEEAREVSNRQQSVVRVEWSTIGCPLPPPTSAGVFCFFSLQKIFSGYKNGASSFLKM